jgi:SAM-dependent methyltransferase
MLARLAATTPGARAVRGVAEAIPLASAALDAVLASSAWHWFDPPAATAEIARVLRPGGVLGLLWSRADPTVDWVAGVRGIGKAAADGSATLSRRGFDIALPPGHGFVDELPEAVTVPWTRAMTRDDVAGMVCTYSGVLELPAADQDAVHRAAREYLDTTFPAAASSRCRSRRWCGAGRGPELRPGAACAGAGSPARGAGPASGRRAGRARAPRRASPGSPGGAGR